MEKNINSLKLAYLGDAVYSFVVREYILNNYEQKYKMNDLHKVTSNIVCAKSQSEVIDYLIENNLLSEIEVEVYKNARNQHTHSKSKNSSIVDYRKATGFEALIAYDYYNDKNRFYELIEIIKSYIIKFIK